MSSAFHWKTTEGGETSVGKCVQRWDDFYDEMNMRLPWLVADGLDEDNPMGGGIHNFAAFRSEALLTSFGDHHIDGPSCNSVVPSSALPGLAKLKVPSCT